MIDLIVIKCKMIISLHNIYTDPAKQCTNVTVEEVEYGDWECKTAVWEDMADPTNEAKICVVKHLKCWDGRYADCALICIDNSTHFGWYYQVKIGSLPFLDLNKITIVKLLIK